MLDLPPFDHILNTLEYVVHCGHPMRRQLVISEFEVATPIVQLVERPISEWEVVGSNPGAPYQRCKNWY